MCLLGAYFAKSLFSEHQIDVATRIKFWKQPKSTKVHKKSAAGDAGSAEIHSTFKTIRLSFDFARRVPYGACKAPAGDLAGRYLLASRSMRSLQACRM
jgi:hypothetical protein